MKFALIPARGGSKRIPLKNIKPFAGKPLISYSIEAARKSGLFDRIVVSTDSTEVAKAAKDCGAEVPFMRPAELSTDFATTQDVVKHALDFVISESGPVDYFCCIYPTAPMISAAELKKAYQKLLSMPDALLVYSVASFAHPIFRAFKINQRGFAEMIWPEHELTRSNDLPEAFHDAGQFYWINASSFILNPRMRDPAIVPHILPRFMVQDIDTEEDWATAELLYEAAKSRGLVG